MDIEGTVRGLLDRGIKKIVPLKELSLIHGICSSCGGSVGLFNHLSGASVNLSTEKVGEITHPWVEEGLFSYHTDNVFLEEEGKYLNLQFLILKDVVDLPNKYKVSGQSLNGGVKQQYRYDPITISEEWSDNLLEISLSSINSYLFNVNNMFSSPTNYSQRIALTDEVRFVRDTYVRDYLKGKYLVAINYSSASGGFLECFKDHIIYKSPQFYNMWHSRDTNYLNLYLLKF